MKRDNQVITIFALLIVISAIYRVIPFENRPPWLGGPQLAIAIFAGSIIKDRKWAFAIPIFSMLIGDLLMEGLFSIGATSYKGFYSGQLLNYALFAMLTVVGFFINHRKTSSIIGGMIAAPTLYFILSNFAVWVSGGGLHRPKTTAGLMQCYADALPFYGSSLLTMAVFGTVLFVGYSMITAGKAYKGIKA
jgi:hypothetical protein